MPRATGVMQSKQARAKTGVRTACEHAAWLVLVGGDTVRVEVLKRKNYGAFWLGGGGGRGMRLCGACASRGRRVKERSAGESGKSNVRGTAVCFFYEWETQQRHSRQGGCSEQQTKDCISTTICKD